MRYSYAPGIDMDIAVTAWWAKMYADGDLPRAFTREGSTLSALFRMIQPPGRGLLFELEPGASAPWLAMWWEQTMDVVYCGLWIARERRGQRRALRTMLSMYHSALRFYPAILVVTKQPAVRDMLARIGFEIAGPIPGFWDGEPAWHGCLTRAGFAGGRYASLLVEEDADGGTDRQGREGGEVERGGGPLERGDQPHQPIGAPAQRGDGADARIPANGWRRSGAAHRPTLD